MLVLIDNGHGSLINGKYQTAGKRKDWQDKGVIYEGEFNRAIVNGIIDFHISTIIRTKVQVFNETAPLWLEHWLQLYQNKKLQNN